MKKFFSHVLGFFVPSKNPPISFFYSIFLLYFGIIFLLWVLLGENFNSEGEMIVPFLFSSFFFQHYLWRFLRTYSLFFRRFKILQWIFYFLLVFSFVITVSLLHEFFSYSCDWNSHELCGWGRDIAFFLWLFISFGIFIFSWIVFVWCVFWQEKNNIVVSKKTSSFFLSEKFLKWRQSKKFRYFLQFFLFVFLIRWIFFSYHSFGNGFYTSGGKIYFYQWQEPRDYSVYMEVPDVDFWSFEVLEDGCAKDKNNVYCY